MIIWSSKLFMSDSIKEKNLKKFKKIKKKIEKPNHTNQIFNHFKKEDHDVQIVGVAGGSDEAQELAGGIIAKLVNDGYELSPDGVNAYFGIN